MRVCSCCKEAKDLSDFSKASRNKDGLDYRCKVCRNASTSRWKSSNKAKVAKSEKSWRQRNHNQKLDLNRRYRARKLQIFVEPYSTKDVIETYGTTCYLCGFGIDMLAARQTGKPGWQVALHIDHLIPLSKGGPDSLENVRPAHGLCNLKKTNRLPTQ